MSKNIEYHTAIVKNSCRICCDKLEMPTFYRCQDYSSDLECFFGIDMSETDILIHPAHFCRKCKRALDHRKAAQLKGENKIISRQPVTWCKHPRTGECSVCLRYGKRGRKPKPKRLPACRIQAVSTTSQLLNSSQSQKLGLPSDTDQALSESLLLTIKATSGSSFKSSPEIPLLVDRFTDSTTNFECLVCKEVLDQPVQLLCKGNHFFCAECLSQWVQNSPTCPVCRVSVSCENIVSIPTYFRNLLAGLKLSCDYSWKGCPQYIALGEMVSHVQNCAYRDSAMPVYVEHDYALPPAYTQPPKTLLQTSPIMGVNQKEKRREFTSQNAVDVLLDVKNLENVHGFEELATKFVKSKLEQTPNSRKGVPVQFKTSGLPFHMTYVRKPMRDSAEASTATKRKRAQLMENHRLTVSGSEASASHQFHSELKRCKEKQEMLQTMNMVPEIPEGAGLMLKTDLSMPWNKLRKLRRWMKKWKVRLPGEGKDRFQAKSLLDGIGIKSAEILLHFKVKNSVTGKLCSELQLTPAIGVVDLKELCERYLSDLSRQVS
ncbi:uncharacterized protein [Ptychodera flava]|uniref:uncharacterized protein n=1 Tax=Ptychodera flava TaxID=63121 RepID=UPI00396A14FD